MIDVCIDANTQIFYGYRSGWGNATDAMYVCMYVFMYVFMFVCSSSKVTYIYIYIYAYIHIHTYMLIMYNTINGIPLDGNIGMHIHTYIYIYIHVYIHTVQ
jgi:hypothetical protein